MARPKRKKVKKERLHREPIVRRVAELLDTGTPTKWRWTSEARHGLRAAMCLKGMTWAAADKRAEEIVTLARHRIGLSQFPTWRDAQGEVPQEREYWFCTACGGFMRGNGSPWCSETCRNVLRMRQRHEAGRLDDAAREGARRIMLTGGAEPAHWQKVERSCHHCGKLYKPTLQRQRYCSRSCGANAARGPSRDCLICATPFAPKQEAQIYCSSACSDEAERRQRRELYRARARVHSLVCTACDQPFTSTRSYQLRCSPECDAEHERRRSRAKARRARAQRRARTLEPEPDLALAAD